MPTVLTIAEWPLCLAEAWGSCLGSRVAIVICEKEGTKGERKRRWEDDTGTEKKDEESKGETNGGGTGARTVDNRMTRYRSQGPLKVT